MSDTLNGAVGSPNRAEVGKIGEDTACKYLKKHGFTIIERNYRKKWGEIDVVARKACPTSGGDMSYTLHFVEVKAVSGKKVGYEPEENVHPWKLKRLSRAIQTYLLERKIDEEQFWQIDVITVELDFDTRNAKVLMLEDVSL